VSSSPKFSQGSVPSISRFLKMHLSEKAKSVYARWGRLLPRIPFPLRLSYDAWWLGRRDEISALLASGQFEKTERKFVELISRLGMTVLNIGAHHGDYTLLSPKRLGVHGREISFEPPLRERKALRWHLSLNRCSNVQVQSTLTPC